MTTREPPGQAALPPVEPSPLRSSFARQVHDALAHLYDPVYLQTHPLIRFLDDASEHGALRPGQALRAIIREAIDALGPEGSASDAPTGRGHQLLVLRYVEGLDSAAVQQRMALSRRQYFREHNRALSAVVSLLTARWKIGESDAERLPGEDTTSGGASTTTLPVALTSFVGRERELMELKEILRQTRLLTLTGSGGCGKTRLALQLGAELRSDYADGVLLVELASLSNADLVPQTVSFSLGLREERDQPTANTVANYLQPKHLLLILDNCEHLLGACAVLVEALLRTCPRLRMLVTSREALGIGGETRWRVPSLGAPPPEAWADDPTTVGRYEAVRLFVERARAVQPGFQLTAENTPAVAEVCWRLDGIPLAVELVAAKIRVLGARDLVHRLDDRLRLLTGGSRTSLPRQQTLRATMDWSHELLSPTEKVLFRRLAVFAGGWTLEAAEAVCGDWQAAVETASIGSGEVLDLLTQLVDRSLVSVDQTVAGTRYRFLETVRQYAAEKLDQGHEAGNAERRHRDWFVAYAERELPHMVGREQLHCTQRLAAEYANFHAALAWSRNDPNGAETELRLASALARYWRWLGRWAEAEAWLEDGLSRCGLVVSEARARALSLLSIIRSQHSDDLDVPLAMAEEAIAIARRLGDASLLALTLRQAGLVLATKGDTGTARGCLDEAEAIAHASGDRREECAAQGFRAIFITFYGSPSNPLAATRELEHSFSIARGLGDATLLAETASSLGDVLVGVGDYERARAVLEQGLMAAQSIGYSEHLAWPHASLGDMALFKGDARAAVAYYAPLFAWAVGTGFAACVLHSALRVATLGLLSGDREGAVRISAWCDARRDCAASTRGYYNLYVRAHAVGEIRALHERALAEAREGMGETAFATAWEAGRALTLEEVGDIGKRLLKALQASSPGS